MKQALLLLFLFLSVEAFTQSDVTNKTSPPIKVFYSQKLINSKTVEVLQRGILAFEVTHNFGDIAGTNGGVKRFFGLDNASDVRIGFQLGLSDKLNIIAARAKGAGIVQQLWELGLKYQVAQQKEDAAHPLAITIYANNVISGMQANTVADQENSFSGTSSRMSQVVQVMLARKIGKTGLQLSPTYVHTNYVQPGDDKNLFALGAAARIPLSSRMFLLVDYFHSFRSTSSKDFYNSQGIKFYDVLGAGLEILTAGHVFHINFTNSTEILENRFLPRTVTSWGKGQFRWGFAIARNFSVFKSKK
jgi:hypothetical protein